MIVNSKKVLEDAKKENRAVVAPDFFDLVSAKAFVNVAKRRNEPIILAYAESFKEFFPLEEAAAIGKVVAESVDVPIVLHLDHGESFEFLKKAIDLGFSSVMIDASMKSFDENVAITKQVVEYAHARNVTVEAEIGHVGQGNSYESNVKTDSIYTTKEEALKFYEQTKVDSLAISIGTAHGVYKGIGTPKLNFDCLHDIAKEIPIPLVLHGGSGSGDDNLHKCATEGISKINVFTDFLLGAMDSINKEKPEDYLKMKQVSMKGMEEVLDKYMDLFQ